LIREDVAAVALANDSDPATNITGFARMPGRMIVASANPISNLETWRINHRHGRRRSGKGFGGILGFQDTGTQVFICWTGRNSGSQFGLGYQSFFHNQLFQSGQPVFVIGMAQVIDRVLPFTGMA
jgi:hypothetical protein